MEYPVLLLLVALLHYGALAAALQDLSPGDAAEARTQHRAGMIFPLLLAISRRLAALVPTALMSLMAIVAMVLFAKKAFMMSAAALALSLYDSYKRKHQKHQKHAEVYHEFLPHQHIAEIPHQHIAEIPHQHVAEIHWKPRPAKQRVSSYYRRPFPSPSPHRPSSYDVPLHTLPSSYYRQPALSHSYSLNHAPNESSSYDVVDDYQPFAGGAAYVSDNSAASLSTASTEQHASFAPYYPSQQQSEEDFPQSQQQQQQQQQQTPANHQPRQQQEQSSEFQPLVRMQQQQQGWVRSRRAPRSAGRS